uniref:Putative secreted peptide n=1 Tax=Anopheles braziliensis TaxID=58242 RepID=A0A2M3ZTV1_9DIPT
MLLLLALLPLPRAAALLLLCCWPTLLLLFGCCCGCCCCCGDCCAEGGTAERFGRTRPRTSGTIGGTGGREKSSDRISAVECDSIRGAPLPPPPPVIATLLPPPCSGKCACALLLSGSNTERGR